MSPANPWQNLPSPPKTWKHPKNLWAKKKEKKRKEKRISRTGQTISINLESIPKILGIFPSLLERKKKRETYSCGDGASTRDAQIPPILPCKRLSRIVGRFVPGTFPGTALVGRRPRCEDGEISATNQWPANELRGFCLLLEPRVYGRDRPLL